MSNRIDQKFASLRAAGRKGFVAYITAGDPDLEQTLGYAIELEKAGVDVLELGIPFSDPLADGTVNQLAAQRALNSKTTLHGILDMVARLRERSQIPVVFFTYLNPIYCYGFAKFCNHAVRAGADGMLILDLPPDETATEFDAVDGLARIRLIAPTTPPERIREIAGTGSGFLYYVSREGVTGEQQSLSEGIGARVAEIRALTDLPIAVGFGISTPDQAREVARGADAVVVGSAIVRKIADLGKGPEAAEALGEFVRPIAQAIAGV